MRHITYATSDTYPIALLIKTNAFECNAIENHYIKALSHSIHSNKIVAYDLKYDDNDKITIKNAKKYLEELLPELDSLGVKHIYCADATYFKILSKCKKAEINLGYSFNCVIKNYEHFKIILGINYKSLIFNPNNIEKLNLSLKTLINVYQQKGSLFQKAFLKAADYPLTVPAIKKALCKLYQYPQLACDIETFSLDHSKASIATIAFSWNEDTGIAFSIDHSKFDPSLSSLPVRTLLKEFLQTYTGKLIFHNATFDIKVLIYELWMKNPEDTEGLLKGLNVLTRNFEDTKIISYLALNSTANIDLSLKALAQEHAGNYAQEDIKDVSKILFDDLLRYNLVDACCTNYVFNKYYPIMVKDQQKDLYYSLMLPSLKLIIQTELTGMPLNLTRVKEVKDKLLQIKYVNQDIILNHSLVALTTKKLRKIAWNTDYLTRKFKAKYPENIKPKATYPDVEFNPSSSKQLQILLYEVMDLPVLEKTQTGLPATGSDVLNKLINHTDNQSYKDLLTAINTRSKAEKILNTFIVAFENAIDHGNNYYWLHGSFNLGGTVSGRMSSSAPNLQNLPANSTYGKLIKSCFQAPDNWLFVGADFNSLEDYVSALITKDPNKLKIYEENYDAHCLRAYSYFPDQLQSIKNTVQSINSIKSLFPDLRQASKGPTFALTYMGTFHTLMKNFGFDINTAKQIETNYHKLYKVSDDWVKSKIDQATIDGYVTGAFGLRLRTPLIAQTLRNNKATPYEAEAEIRTAGNMLGQSYGLLNNRAACDFMEKVHKSKYCHDIKPCGLIHDSIYLVIKNDIDVVTWVNKELIKSMQWQDLPELKHPKVTLSAELDIHYQGWHQPISIPNDASPDEILNLCNAEAKKYAN